MPTIKKKRNRKPHERRKRPNNKFYNSTAWRRCAKTYEAENPLCEECLRHGKTTDATGRKGVTDHIKPINQGGEPFDWDNLQRLCNYHHNQKSGREAHKGSSKLS